MKKHPLRVREYNWQEMDEGETVRLHCDHPMCAHKIGKALTITRLYDGCIYNCYRCGTSGKITRHSTPGAARRKLKEIRNERKNAGDPNNYMVVLPNDFISLVFNQVYGATSIYDVVPSIAYSWLYRYELDSNDMYTYNIGYSPKLQRVIIPIYENNTLIGWQGRDVYYERNKANYILNIKDNKQSEKPLKYYTEYNKYINNNKKLYFKILNNSILNFKKDNIYNKRNINSTLKVCILVEDILSCIKVYNKFKYDTIALLNSTITDTTCTELNLLDYDRVYIWLDYDARIKALRASRKLQSLGIDCKTIRTEQDPKSILYKDMRLW